MDDASSMVKFQRYFFIAMGFLLGSVIPLFGNIFNFVLLIFVVILLLINRRQVFIDLNRARWYIGINIVLLLYFSLHTFVVLLKGNSSVTPSFGTFEALILNFVLVPIYVATFKAWLTPRLLIKFLFYFCLGCLLVNFYIMFSLVGSQLFSSPTDAFNFLYNSRFGDNRPVFGHKLWLEMQAMVIAMAALISYLFVILRKGYFVKLICGFMFLAFVMFLSFTVTKSAIFGFLLGFVVINIYLFKISSLWERIGLVGGALVVVFSFVFLMDLSKYEERLLQMEQEIQSVQSGEFVGSSLASRVAFIKESFRHFDEFSVWGLGIYTKNRIKEWFEASDLNISIYNNVHNTFLQYWITAGIVGLSVVLFLFIAPLCRMIKRRKFSFLVMALLLVCTAVSCTCVTLSRGNARVVLLIFLAMFYFYGDIFFQLENDISRDKPSSI